MSNGIYERIRAGEIVPVHTEQGRRFCMQHELMHGCINCYSALIDGKRIKEHNRLMLDETTARDWCENLIADRDDEDIVFFELLKFRASMWYYEVYVQRGSEICKIRPGNTPYKTKQEADRAGGKAVESLVAWQKERQAREIGA